MLDLEEVENTIHELENADTTFDTCIKLSSLYIVREYLNKPVSGVIDGLSSAVEEELSDILPSYKKYCRVKRAYQLHETDKEHILVEMQKVCQEIQEFIQALYSHTDTSEERTYIKNVLTILSTQYT